MVPINSAAQAVPLAVSNIRASEQFINHSGAIRIEG